jgi:predicted dehydrogenase
MAIEGRKEVRGGGRIRLGMVGGGEGAFIGAVHRLAARMDDHYELVAGALSSTPQRSQASGAALGLSAERVYDDFAAMARAEAARPDGIEAVAIVTPNHLHAAAAHAFLSVGVHVICDKPLTTSLAEARKLKVAAERSGRNFAVTYNYTGLPLVRRAREMVQAGELGDIRLVQVEYAQDWLTTPIENSGQKQAAWRVDPAQSGAGGAIGDIGTHAYHLADYVGGLAPSELSAELTSFGAGRVLDDNAQVMLRYAGGARGALWASQVAPGHENGLHLRIYGTKGGLEWVQQDPNRLLWSPLGQSTRIITRGGPDAGAAAARVTRIPPGHPEGYLEGFANIYAEIAAAIKAARTGSKPPKGVHFPTVDDGVKGLAFIEAAVKSSRANGRWTKLPA